MNEKLIEHFKIKSDNSRLPRIFLQSDEGTARRLRECLYAHKQFWCDITLNFYDFPVVLIIVDCEKRANVYDFLELEAVRRVLIESIGKEVTNGEV